MLAVVASTELSEQQKLQQLEACVQQVMGLMEGDQELQQLEAALLASIRSYNAKATEEPGARPVSRWGGLSADKSPASRAPDKGEIRARLAARLAAAAAAGAAGAGGGGGASPPPATAATAGEPTAAALPGGRAPLDVGGCSGRVPLTAAAASSPPSSMLQAQAQRHQNPGAPIHQNPRSHTHQNPGAPIHQNPIYQNPGAPTLKLPPTQPPTPWAPGGAGACVRVVAYGLGSLATLGQEEGEPRQGGRQGGAVAQGSSSGRAAFRLYQLALALLLPRVWARAAQAAAAGPRVAGAAGHGGGGAVGRGGGGVGGGAAPAAGEGQRAVACNTDPQVEAASAVQQCGSSIAVQFYDPAYSAFDRQLVTALGGVVLTAPTAAGQGSDESPAPGDESPAPGDESPAPGDESPAPGDESPAPGDESPTPGDTPCPAGHGATAVAKEPGSVTGHASSLPSTSTSSLPSTCSTPGLHANVATLFYMPCCPRQLYDQVVACNQLKGGGSLQRAAILGNSFSSLRDSSALFAVLTGDQGGADGAEMLVRMCERGEVEEVACPDLASHGVATAVHMFPPQDPAHTQTFV